MCKYIFLLPLYNDWESFSLLLEKISKELSIIKKKAEILIVNDCSNIRPPKFKKYSNILKIKILNLRENLGSQKAISIGLAYLKNLEEEMIITVLDSDGEDDPNSLETFLSHLDEDATKVVVAERKKRKENIFLRILNIIRLASRIVIIFK